MASIKPVELLIKARDEASGILGTVTGKLSAIGAAIATYFGVNAFIGAVKGAADLEAKLSEVKAVSGATAAEMVQLRQAAEAAGASTKFTATEAAGALGNLTRAGLSAKDSITALPAVLALAQAGGIGLGEASEYVTKAVMGLGLAFKDAGRVADVLAAGANASNTSVTGLAQALSYAAPVAKSLGLSLETTVAIIGKFADAGIDASRAGTALNAVLSQFSDPASKFRMELGAAGIITGNFEQALHQLAKAGPAGEKAILAVGTEAGPALRALLNQGIGALDDLKGKLDAAGGSAAATAAVMEDNLKGSFNSLSSAWDTVKNALATPVLPVIRDGVTSLSDALTKAVSNGTIGRFGDAIATAFQGGIKWAKEFAGQVDVTALIARLQAFAGEAQQTFTTVGEYARNAGDIVQTVYGVMSAGTNTVLAVIYKLAEAFSGVASNIQSGLALLMEGLAKITFGGISASFKQAAADVKLSAEATWAVSEAFAKKAEDAFNSAADGAETARKGWAGLTADTSAAATQAATSQQVFKSVAETLKEVGGDATAAGQKAQAAGILQKEAAEAARTAVAGLKTEYEAALASGNVQLALEKLQAMQGALKSTGDQAAMTGKDIENAFTRMGVTSSTELGKLRDAALRDYKIISDAGTSTARDKAEAFRVYAEKAIAANDGVATEAVKVEAAMRGLEIQTDATGKSIVKSMDSGAASTINLGNSVRATTEQLKAQQAALDAVNAKYAGPAYKIGTGATRDERLSGQNAVDDTLRLRLAQKLQTGTLTSADAADVKAFADAVAQNVAVSESASPGLVSVDFLRSLQTMQTQVLLMQQAMAARPVNAAPASTVNVQITLPNGTSQTVPTTQAGAAALIASLQGAKLAAGG